ncbi:hypothetical protein [Moorena sp. SIO1F2]|nr:hypothetical protein [Moorena sp. SIO1F2]
MHRNFFIPPQLPVPRSAVPYSLLPTPYSPLPTPYSLLNTPPE